LKGGDFEMSTLFKKALKMWSVGFAIVYFALALPVGASEHPERKSPRLYHPENITNNSVSMEVRFKERKRDDVAVRVRMVDHRTGIVSWREFPVRLDRDGRAMVHVGHLNPATTYSFRTDVRKITLNRFSKNSNTITATTTHSPAPTATVPATTNNMSTNQ
jgi:hypothetical protein